jgi:hypothetical protein
MTTKIRLTKAQREALALYERRLRSEDNFLGSVFVTPKLQAEYEGRTKAAYEVCVSLGMGPEHGL